MRRQRRQRWPPRMKISMLGQAFPPQRPQKCACYRSLIAWRGGSKPSGRRSMAPAQVHTAPRRAMPHTTRHQTTPHRTMRIPHHTRGPRSHASPATDELQHTSEPAQANELAATTLLPPIRRLGSSCIKLIMRDTYSDGWNNAAWTWSDSAGAALDTGTLASGGSGTDSICGVGVGCYSFTVSSGSYPTEISWTLQDEDSELAAGGAPTTAASVCFTGDPTPAPTTTAAPSNTHAPSPKPTAFLPSPSPTLHKACDFFVLAGNPPSNTDSLGTYSYLGLDSATEPYFEHSGGTYFMKKTSGNWYVMDDLDNPTGYYWYVLSLLPPVLACAVPPNHQVWAAGRTPNLSYSNLACHTRAGIYTTSNPEDASAWLTPVSGAWTAQPSVTASCLYPTSAPTDTPTQLPTTSSPTMESEPSALPTMSLLPTLLPTTPAPTTPVPTTSLVPTPAPSLHKAVRVRRRACTHITHMRMHTHTHVSAALSPTPPICRDPYHAPALTSNSVRLHRAEWRRRIKQRISWSVRVRGTG